MPEREVRENGIEDIFEGMIMENFPDLMENTNLYIQDIQQTPKRTNIRRSTSRDITGKMLKGKDKDKILKSKEKKWTIMYKWTSIRPTANISLETLSECHGITYSKC